MQLSFSVIVGDIRKTLEDEKSPPIYIISATVDLIEALLNLWS